MFYLAKTLVCASFLRAQVGNMKMKNNLWKKYSVEIEFNESL